MDELVTWLQVQIDADEREVHDDPGGMCDGGLHLDSVRALAEINAKRRIIDKVVPAADGLDLSVDQDFRVGPRDTATEPYLGDALLTIMALPYAGRAGYRDEWRPTGEYA